MAQQRRGGLRLPFIPWALTLLVGLGLLLGSSSALAAGGLAPTGVRPGTLKKDDPFKVTAEAKRTEATKAVVTVSIWMFKDDHYIYEDATSITVAAPPGIKAGPQRIPPSKVKFDENFGEDVSVFTGTPTFQVPLDVDASLNGKKVILPVTVKLRGCNPTQCFFPQTESLSLTLDLTQPAPSSAALPGGSTSPPQEDSAFKEAIKGTAKASAVAPPTLPKDAALSAAQSPQIDADGDLFGGSSDVGEVAQKSLVLALVLAFGAGILTSLTPCVYPVIPITLRVLGASQADSKITAFTLAFVYVLGMALIYTLLGVVAASSGGYLGQWLQSKAVLGFLVVVFVAMGFSMLGAFDMALPSGIANRLENVEGRGYPGAFLAGAVSGIVVGPCSAPVLLSLLTYIAQTGNIAIGSLLMFTYAMGIGVLFLVLGTFAASVSTPRSGPWMDAVKGFLALMIFAVALYYLGFLVPEGIHTLSIGLFAIITGVFMGAFHPITWDDLWQRKARKAIGVIALTIGLFFTLDGVSLARGGAGLGGLAAQGQAAPTKAGFEWMTSEAEGIKMAAVAGKPVIIDFTADWCAACQELKHEVFADERVIDEMASFVPVMLDCTNNDDPEVLALMKKYEVLALPKVVFIDAQGQVLEDLAVTALVTPEDFLGRMTDALSL